MIRVFTQKRATRILSGWPCILSVWFPPYGENTTGDSILERFLTISFCIEDGGNLPLGDKCNIATLKGNQDEFLVSWIIVHGINIKIWYTLNNKKARRLAASRWRLFNWTTVIRWQSVLHGKLYRLFLDKLQVLIVMLQIQCFKI